MHLSCLFQGFKRVHRTRICVWHCFFEKLKSSCCGAIINNIIYSPICVLEEKYREFKHTLKNIIWTFFQGTCTVNYSFKVTSSDSLWPIFIYYYIVIWLIGLENWRRKLTWTVIYKIIGLDITIFQNNATNLKRKVFRRSDDSGTGMQLSLILVPTF